MTLIKPRAAISLTLFNNYMYALRFEDLAVRTRVEPHTKRRVYCIRYDTLRNHLNRELLRVSS